tara:strand:- start:1850 stop:2320 length:471 start_codon:yes stop_codon:yes gene_type:complete
MITRNLFAAIMSTTIFSLLCALIFLLMDGVDVSLTEAAVGAGISTILYLSALKHTHIIIKPSKHAAAPLVVIFILMLLLLGAMTYDIPNVGEPNSASNSRVTQHYIDRSNKEMGIPNMVTSILASYRGFDTLGEVVVIFIAGISVIGILRNKKVKS